MLKKIIYAFVALIIFSAATPQHNEKFIQAPGATLFSEIIGSGSPVIVIHGGAGYLTHDHLLPHMEPLAKHNQVIFYDQRGLGRSTGEINPENINLNTYLEDIETIRLSLGAKKVSLLGHSWGSFLAVRYAIRYPESVDKLILVSSMPASSNDLGLFFTELQKRLAPYHEKIEKIESSELYLSGDPETVANDQKLVFQTYMFCPENITKLNLRNSQKANQNGFKVWEIFKEQIFRKPYDITSQLSSIQRPTLILHGDADPIPFVIAEHLNRAIPNSKLIKIEQSGHFPFVEQPECFFKAIEDFLNCRKD